MPPRYGWGFISLFSLCLCLAADGFAARQDVPRAEPEDRLDSAATQNHLVKHGVIVDFETQPVGGGDGPALVEGQLAEVRFRLTEEATGSPIRGVTPGVWMDMGEVLQGQPGAQQKSCKEKIALYLKGVVGIRPMIDLNSYYVVILNQEPSVSIVDPLVSMAGKTSTLAMIRLNGSGADWVRSADEKHIYVSMPKVGQVAVLDTVAFKVTANIDAGNTPTRLALQPDGRYLWVGNNAASLEASGVSVIDTETLERKASLVTGVGHHEIAFSDDSRYAFVSNRDAGTVSVIDVQKLQIVKELATGPLPISLAYSPLAQALYVADGKDGTVAVVAGQDLKITQRITLQPGLGPLRLTPDGRWGLVVNPAADAVHVIDVASNTPVHRIGVSGQPYQLMFSRAFAYVRALGSERVTLINLASLGEGQEPIVQGFAAGDVAPKLAGDLPLADSMASTSSEAAVFVVNPADNTTYAYMEGMNAPSSNYKVYGGNARAVTVVDRSLRETEPGLYSAKVTVPAAGRYDVAFVLETPELLHCFSAEAKPNPRLKHQRAALGIEYLREERRVKAGETVALRFRLIEPATGQPSTGLKDVRVLYFRVPGADRTEVFAEEEGDGVYLARLTFPRAGAYALHVGVNSQGVGYQDLPYFTLLAAKQAVSVSKPDQEVRP